MLGFLIRNLGENQRVKRSLETRAGKKKKKKPGLRRSDGRPRGPRLMCTADEHGLRRGTGTQGTGPEGPCCALGQERSWEGAEGSRQGWAWAQKD